MEDLVNLHRQDGIVVTHGVVGHSLEHTLSIGGFLLTVSLASLSNPNELIALAILSCVVGIFFSVRGYLFNVNYHDGTVIRSSYVFFYRTDISRIDPENIVLKIHENWISTKTFRLLIVDSEGDHHEMQRLKSDQLEDLGAEIARGLDIEFVIEDES